MGVNFKVERNDISPKLSKAAAAAKNPTPVFRAMGTTFMSITMGNFKDANAAYRPKSWDPKRDGTPSHLQKSGTLSRSFHLEVGPDHATVSNPMVYAAIHQFGGTIHAKDGSFLRFKWGPGKGDWACVKSVKIPARPFFPVGEDGKLTAKAEEKIGAAGKRAMERQIGT
jgi:phage gpG-like protein